jgi:preprotein translocase subunit SecG
MLVAILLALNIVVCVALVGVVLLQRSEGGALGMGGGPSGFMTARGAGNLLTQVTWGLAATFFILSLVLTILSGGQSGASSVVNRMKVDPMDMKALNKAPPPPASDQPAQPAAPVPAPGSAPSLDNPFGLPGPAPSK